MCERGHAGAFGDLDPGGTGARGCRGLGDHRESAGLERRRDELVAVPRGALRRDEQSARADLARVVAEVIHNHGCGSRHGQDREASDEVAEHIPGCNMAFTKKVVEEIRGFEPIFAAAGDDVDFCWRLQNRGYVVGFSPSATVWHYRRNTVRAYLKQQMGYGKAEALLYFKHPHRFNMLGQSRWLGRIYGELTTAVLSRRPVIYFGAFGRGLFQSMYEPPSSLLSSSADGSAVSATSASSTPSPFVPSAGGASAPIGVRFP